MLQMIGRSTHSAFRLAKLLALLQENNSNITALRSEYRYFIEPKDEHELNPTEQDLLSTLLEAKAVQSNIDDKETFFLVTPRPGTISPWSSKATDIVHNSGLETVARVERGIAFFVETNTSLSLKQWQPIMALLHDRMIE